MTVHHTDLAQKTFERAMESVSGHVSPDLISDLKSLLIEGKVHQTELIVAAVKKRTSEYRTSAD